MIATTGARVERISVVIPMYNEARHIEHLVEDLAAQEYEGEVEIFVADGASTDGSGELLVAAAARAGLDVTVIPNPHRWVSHGLNACIERASGDLIVRLDCHARYASDYLSASARAAEETGAWAVGGVPRPVGSTEMERAVACALAGPFGGAHWTRNEASGRRADVDNFFCGAFRPMAFQEAGVFDETLVRNQDDELNFRIRQAGGRLVLDPQIRSEYVPRGSFQSLARQYYQYGVWKVPVMRKHRAILSARSMAPAALAASLATLAVTSTMSSTARRLLVLEASGYAIAAGIFGLKAVLRRDESLRLLPRVVASFPTMHLGYGAGLFAGLARTIRR
jgi:succinoglycan biosynthesis protein ExoA